MPPARSRKRASKWSCGPLPITVGRPRAARGRGRRDVGWSAACDQRPRRRSEVAARVLLRRRGARSLLHHRRRAASRLQASRSHGCEIRQRLGSADAVDLPAGRSAKSRRRSRQGRSYRRPQHGRERGSAAAGKIDAIQVFQPYAERLLSSGKGHIWYAAADSRPHRLHDPGDPARRAGQARRGAAAHDARRPSHAGLVRCGRRRAEIAERRRDYFPDVAADIFAASSTGIRARTVGQRSRDPARGLRPAARRDARRGDAPSRHRLRGMRRHKARRAGHG